MEKRQSGIACILALTGAMALTAAVYSYTIFSNFCMDGDTLNWTASLVPLQSRMTFLSCIGLKEWFAKFHLLMFSFVYGIAKLYSLRGGWDLLMGFKICTLLCAVLTVPLLFTICRNTMKSLPLALLTSLIPLYTLGYSWLITTCDDNVLANFFNLIFVTCVLVATGAIRGEARERHCLLWPLLTGIAAGLSIATHMKNIVALPIILALVVVKPPRPRMRLKIAAAGLLGLILSFGLLYWAYWTQSAAEPASSKLDFWVFHRVPGRFFLTPPHPPLRDHLVFVLVGIRASLYAFQELFVHTNIYDGDVLGYAVIALFFILYFVSVGGAWRSRAVKILFALFLCDAGHSFLYDSWVVERWDSFTLPVFITIGIFWDRSLTGQRERGGARGALFSVLLCLFFGTLVASNIRSTRLLIGITGNRMPYRPPATPWPYGNKLYFYFDHRGLYSMARQLDRYFDEDTYFLSLRFMPASSSYAYAVLDQYLTCYSKNYRRRLIENPNLIGSLVSQGKLKKLIYLDTVRIPWFTGTARQLIMFDPAITRTLLENSQVVLKEARFTQPAAL